MSKRIDTLKTILDYVNYRTDKKIKESKDPEALKAIIDYTQYLTDNKLEKIKEELKPIEGPRGIEGADGLDGDKGDKGIQGTKGDKGETGEEGIQGPKGNQGLQGVQGIKGNKGEIGSQGIEGIKGLQGIEGIKGNTGEQGFQGIKGDKGDKGNKGYTGGIGNTGEQGIQGETGIQGPKGSKGSKGNEGPQGVEGPKGTKGSKGIQGNIGNAGEQGIQGETGIQGPKGSKGSKGKNFEKRLFEDAVKNLDGEFNKRTRSMRADINKTLEEAVRRSDSRDTQHRRQNPSGASADLLVAGGGLTGAPEAGYIEYIKGFDDDRNKQFYPGQLLLYYSEPNDPITEFDTIGKPVEEQKGTVAEFYRVVENFSIGDGSVPTTFDEAITLGYVMPIAGGSGGSGGVANTYNDYAGTIPSVGSLIYIDNPAKALADGRTYDQDNFIKDARANRQWRLADGIVSRTTIDSVTVTRFGVTDSGRTDLEAGIYYVLGADGNLYNGDISGLEFIQYVGQAISESDIFVRFTIDPERAGNVLDIVPIDSSPTIPTTNRDLIDVTNEYPTIGTTIIDAANDKMYVAIRDYTDTSTNPIWVRTSLDSF